MKKARSSLFLLGAAILWGIAFVAQEKGLDYVEPFTFTSVRCFVGGVALLIFTLIFHGIKRKKHPTSLTKEEKKQAAKNLAVAGLVCGTAMAVAMNVQQVGLRYTTAGKSGFITSCYIVFVPIIGLFFRRKCPVFAWVAVLCAVVGLYLLCLGDGFENVNKGDLIELGCTVGFAMHIICVDIFGKKTDGISLACAQCFVCSFLSAIQMFIFEHPDIQNILNAYVPILYCGVVSAGIAYMFQILGQRDLNPTAASIIMSLESVVSVLAAWVLLNQKLSAREIIGCAVIFVAVLLAQIPQKKRKIKTLY